MYCAIRHTFKAYERLKRKQHIDTLFRTGKAYSVFPVKYIWQLVQLGQGELSPVRVGFTVPKKRFKRAVQRNSIRRLMREAWRLNKHLIDNVPEGQQLQVFLIYVHGEAVEYKVVLDSVMKGIEKLRGQLTIGKADN